MKKMNSKLNEILSEIVHGAYLQPEKVEFGFKSMKEWAALFGKERSSTSELINKIPHETKLFRVMADNQCRKIRHYKILDKRVLALLK